MKLTDFALASDETIYLIWEIMRESLESSQARVVSERQVFMGQGEQPDRSAEVFQFMQPHISQAGAARQHL